MLLLQYLLNIIFQDCQLGHEVPQLLRLILLVSYQLLQTSFLIMKFSIAFQQLHLQTWISFTLHLAPNVDLFTQNFYRHTQANLIQLYQIFPLLHPYCLIKMSYFKLYHLSITIIYQKIYDCAMAMSISCSIYSC
jgi:hypothetical protein